MNNYKQAAIRNGSARTQLIFTKVKNMLDDMREEIQLNGGVYPYNGGKISKNEVCRRAGIGKTTIFSDKQRELNSHVDAWLDQFLPKKNYNSQRKSKTELAAQWKSKFLALSESHHVTELDLQALRSDYDKILEKNVALQCKLDALMESLKSQKVKIIFPIK
ncbi:hypothetical protein [Pseudomonas umsongensis]|uniref:Uncharacterized protein n=1 Tax=Pseudomonas umsongensis TaxID=198618 RepID=A0AAE7DGJ9_9PSED|nr:hypothetical protein [Pseudomonas umsongensis]QJC81568.1 hypothetical protein HGP31_25930 [Pseudomonas umsongensis]